MRIPLLSGAYEGISTNLSAQECINFYYEKASKGENSIGALLPVHGASIFQTVTAGQGRGAFYNPLDNLLYVVVGNTLWEVTSAGSATNRGTLSTSTGLVQMALNPSTTELCIVDGTAGKIFNCNTNTLTTITDGDFPAACTTVVFLNGYFIVNNPSVAGRLAWSTLNDGLTWSATDISTETQFYSPIIDIHLNRRDIWLFGDNRAAIWYNQGDVDFVFSRIEVIETGLAARMSVQSVDNSIIWLARNKLGELNVVRAGDSYQPETISTPQLSRKFTELSSVSDAFAHAYILDGHEFYVLTFPSDNKTWAYDCSTGEWAQRSGAFQLSQPTMYPVAAIAFCSQWGGHIAVDYNSTGKLWSLQESTYTWDSVNMERRVTGPTLYRDNEDRIRIADVQVDIEEGVNSGTETGNDGELTLTYSKDRGHTYSAGVQLNLGRGATQGYSTRLIQRQLGWARNWTFRVYTDTPNKIILKGAYARLYGEPLEGWGLANAGQANQGGK